MRIVKVQYTVRPEFVEQNKSNIQAVMKELREHPIPGLHYSTYQLPDKNTFMHLNFASSKEAIDSFSQLTSFEKFRADLNNSNPISRAESRRAKRGWQQ